MCRPTKQIAPETKFGKLTFVRDEGKRDETGRRMAIFRCFCGNEKSIRVSEVKRGKIKTCGCTKKLSTDVTEEEKQRIIQMAKYTPIREVSRVTHVGVFVINRIIGKSQPKKSNVVEGFFNWKDYKDGIL